MKVTPRMTLIIIYSEDLSRTLLCRRVKNPYKNRWNGVGGKQEKGESPHDCARRELKEETGIDTHLSHIMNLQYTIHSHTSPARLSVFVGVTSQETPEQTDNGSELRWFQTDDITNRRTDDNELAGDGNLPYIVSYGREHLRRLQQCTNSN